MNPDSLVIDFIIIIAAYFIGSISTAIVSCKLLGLPDPRTTGSNNPGATNVLRSGGKKAGAITLMGDMLKGILPVLIASQLQSSTVVLTATGCAAFLGHVFPIYYGFKGGKGVATFYGIVTGLNWPSGLLALIIWGICATVFKISSLAALISVILTPLIIWQFTHLGALTAGAAIMGIIIFWRHRSNIRHLLNGTESRIGHKKENQKSA